MDRGGRRHHVVCCFCVLYGAIGSHRIADYYEGDQTFGVHSNGVEPVSNILAIQNIPDRPLARVKASTITAD